MGSNPPLCPNCLAPRTSDAQGHCAYCGAKLLPEDYFPPSDTLYDQSLASDIIAAAEAGVPPSSQDSALMHLPPPKPHHTWFSSHEHLSAEEVSEPSEELQQAENEFLDSFESPPKSK